MKRQRRPDSRAAAPLHRGGGEVRDAVRPAEDVNDATRQLLATPRCSDAGAGREGEEKALLTGGGGFPESGWSWSPPHSQTPRGG